MVSRDVIPPLIEKARAISPSVIPRPTSPITSRSARPSPMSPTASTTPGELSGSKRSGNPATVSLNAGLTPVIALKIHRFTLTRILAVAAATAAGGSGCSVPQTAPRENIPVILTTDIGTEVDDQWALAHLLLASEEGKIHLLGIVTTHAPNLKAPAAESSAAAAREVLEVVRPRRPPPVLPGSSLPLSDAETPRSGPGPRFIVETSKSYTSLNRLTVIAIGAATDVASALLIDPGTAERIEVLAMGFEGWPKGGDPWNVKNDPLAYRVILDSPVPLVIGPADVCLRHLTLDAERAGEKTRNCGSTGDYLESLLLRWLQEKEELCRTITGQRAWPIWDLITAAHLLGLTQDQIRPRPRLRDDLTFDLDRPGAPDRPTSFRWITAMDEEKLWRDFQERMERWARR